MQQEDYTQKRDELIETAKEIYHSDPSTWES